MQTIKTKHNSLKSIRVCIIFFTTFVLFHYISQAQDLPCANEAFQFKQLEDTAFVKRLVYLQNSSGSQRPNGAILEIPLVVHVLHLGEPVGTGSNISDQQILDAIRGSNERWRKINTTEGVDMEVQFCLAQYDPNGNPSSGIVRKDASSLPNYREIGIGYIEAVLSGEFGSDEILTKNLSNWPHSYVYNIWVVHKIAGGWGGYAFFPLPSGEFSTDGTVITANSMRYSSSTLAHELGHGMGLFHTFQGSENGCPANDLCFIQGDWICDTPPHKKADCSNSICNNSPDSLFAFRNIMSYCGGRGLFTQGQKDRVRTTIYNSSRNQLLQSFACTGRPCDTAKTTLTNETCLDNNAGITYDTLLTVSGCDSIIKTITNLIPATSASFTYLINGSSVTFTNTSSNADSYLWDFGDNSSDTSTAPVHLYSSSGNYTVRLISTNECKSDTITQVLNLNSTNIGKNQTQTKLNIFPNPNTGSFILYLDVKQDDNIVAELVNNLGAIIKTQKLYPGNTHFISTTAHLSKGIYQLILKKNNEITGTCLVSVF